MDGDDGRTGGATAAGADVGCAAADAGAGWASDPSESDPTAVEPSAADPTVGEFSADDDVAGANDVDGVSGGGIGAATGGGGANVGITMPGGGAATANGSSINSTGRSGSCSWNGVPDEDVFTAAPAARGAAAGTAGGSAVTGEVIFTAAAGALAPTDGTAFVRVTAPGGSGVRGVTAFFVPVVAVSAAARAGEAAAAVRGETFWDDADANAGVGVCVAPPLGGIVMGLDTPANVAPARRLDAALAAAAILRATSAALGAADAVAGAAAAGAGVVAAGVEIVAVAVAIAEAARFTPVVVVAPAPLPAFETLLTVLGRALTLTPAVEVDGNRGFAAASATAAAGAAALVAAGAASARGTVPKPFVPSKRAGPPASATPSRISGSSSSLEFEVGSEDADDSVGTNDVSGRASNSGAMAAAGTSSPRSNNAPCDSKSSPASAKELFEAAAATPGAGAAGMEEERPDGSPIPMGSSTGSSARGSKSGREAASIVFEPDSGQSILNLSCNAIAEVPRRWLTERESRTCNVTQITLFGAFPSTSTLQESDGQSSNLPADQIPRRIRI